MSCAEILDLILKKGIWFCSAIELDDYAEPRGFRGFDELRQEAEAAVARELPR